MQAKLETIYYYPVKALPGVELTSVDLVTEERMPGDRQYALAPSSLDFCEPRHVKKSELLVLMKREELAEMKLSFDLASQHIQLSHRGTVVVDGDLNKQESRQALAEFSESLLGTPVQVISAPGIGFTDLSHKSLSIINLASIRDLENKLDCTVDLRRFRANLYIDGIPAWDELKWLEERVSIGDAQLEVYRITDRCAAINVDPASATRDRLLQNLKKLRGNLDMGVYAYVRKGGKIKAGDTLSLIDDNIRVSGRS